MKKKMFSVKNLLKVVWVLYALLSIFVWLPNIDHMLTEDYTAIEKNYVSLDDSWDITINNSTFHDVSLDTFHFPAVRKGDRITMERVLPEDWEIMEGALRLSIRHSAVTMSIDGEVIFEYGHDRIADNKTVGSGFQFINFPEEYQGKTLSIQLDVSEDKMFTKLDSIRIYPWENAYRVIMTENRLPLFFGSFLVIFGLSVCIMTIFAVVFSRKYIRLLCVSIFSFCMGLWTLCYYRVISIYAIPIYSVSLIEYIAFYLAPLPLIVYMYEDVKKLKQKALKVLYWVLLGYDIVSLVVMMTLHTLDIVHLATMMPYMIGIIVSYLIYFLIVIAINFKISRTNDRLYLAGMLIIICCTAYDLIGYGSDRYYGSSAFMNIKGMSSIGVMVLIFILFLSFYFNVTQKMMMETERNLLIKSAYTDELTQLHNRRYCMEYMDKIRKEENFDYTVLCFDLNNLKTVNDTYGHAKGDILIKSAAEVLAETFAEHGIVARMGGDEFIAILDTAEEKKTAAFMEQFRQNVNRKNQQIKNLNLSIACGSASGRESNADIEKVYQTADDRMYEHKKQMKKEKAQKGKPAI